MHGELGLHVFDFAALDRLIRTAKDHDAEIQDGSTIQMSINWEFRV
jgi:hypothetical protein